MQALDQLESKLNTLLKRYAALEARNKSLSETIATQQATITALSGKLELLEKNMAGVHLDKAIDGDEEREQMRSQLENVISEIDRILNTLND